MTDPRREACDILSVHPHTHLPVLTQPAGKAILYQSIRVGPWAVINGSNFTRTAINYLFVQLLGFRFLDADCLQSTLPWENKLRALTNERISLFA